MKSPKRYFPKRYFKVEGKLLTLTNLEKVLYPDCGYKKKDLLSYYQRIAPIVLPHLKDRLFTLNRFPNGVNEEGFYEKQCPSHRPPWVETAFFKETYYCVINNTPTLLWVGNLAAIELHTTLATIANLERPTSVVFDLDPGEGTGFQECAEVSLILRGALQKAELESFPKSSGKKGIHVHVPLNSDISYRETQRFAKNMAEYLERSHPDFVISRMPKSLRRGKVLIDWSQNVNFKTTATAYSLRPGSFPSASVPLKWNEVQRAAKKKSQALDILTFGPDEVLWRVARFGDLYGPMLEMQQILHQRKAAA